MGKVDQIRNASDERRRFGEILKIERYALRSERFNYSND